MKKILKKKINVIKDLFKVHFYTHFEQKKYIAWTYSTFHSLYEYIRATS